MCEKSENLLSILSIEVFKIVHGYYDNITNISLVPHIDVATKGIKYKLYQSSVKYDLRKHFITNKNGIVCLMVLWTLILLIVLKYD